MGDSSPEPPKVEDPSVTAARQQQYNIGAQAGSNINQITPTGSLQYYQTGVGPNGVPIYTAVQQLSPQQQSLLGYSQLGQGLAGGAGANMLANSFDQYSKPADLSANAGGLVDQQMQRFQSYYKPIFDQQTSQMDNQLRNQGIMPGTPAYEQQMRSVRDSQGNTTNSAMMQFEPQAFAQAQQQYANPMQTAAGLMSLNNPTTSVTGAPGAGLQPANYQAAVASAQQAQMAAYQAQLQQQSAMMGGVATLGSAAIKAAPALMAASDRRLKTDITMIGAMFDGTPIYRYRFIGSPLWQVGLMAQDVQLYAPEAVADVGGVLAVDYKAATERAIEVSHARH